MENIDQNKFREKANNDNTVILDVRTPVEWESGVIANAKLLDIMETDNFLSEVQKLDKSKEYLIYCRSGNRSGQACQVMESMGFTKTNNLVGGMLDWTGEVVKK